MVATAVRDARRTNGGDMSAGKHVVTTGVTTNVYDAQPGDHLIADFGPVGAIDLRFTAS